MNIFFASCRQALREGFCDAFRDLDKMPFCVTMFMGVHFFTFFLLLVLNIYLLALHLMYTLILHPAFMPWSGISVSVVLSAMFTALFYVLMRHFWRLAKMKHPSLVRTPK